jgi:hypothetical protein
MLGKLIVISAKIPEEVFQELQIRIPEGERSDFIRDAVIEKLGKIPKPDKILQLEKRIKNLEDALSEVKKFLADIEILTYEHGKIDPTAYCVNDLDREIINYLNLHQGATTPELAKAIGTDRWTILSRLRQIGKRSKKELGKAIVEFDAGERAGKKRAWWLTFKE